ncbi:MAG: hypothetical protein A2887_02985 [Alphaproteobacteria bacterium RIFCSPLOWO2_01_FULL_40_26]|nr:MAG: hypothetical protein A3D15_05580 [Alphaproteobacteria bacterium RIFCSPHIGHO2_02_FULL_40_34]OFW95489.1 MAG: hypothetical protein A2887_02985 [Alphaproteobacteria bacterium RIFCSPLOWO2_01_FULL_40_26]OFX09331.1 MAG: hypothetical protein A3H30_01345 [Alphaproteobacteria bacterium RIFCSPLOWO2_02_FULL_40_19]
MFNQHHRNLHQQFFQIVAKKAQLLELLEELCQLQIQLLQFQFLRFRLHLLQQNKRSQPLQNQQDGEDGFL